MKSDKEKGKSFGKINVIDLLIILSILAVIAAGALYMGFGGLSKGEGKDIYFTVEFLGVQDWFVEKIEENQKSKDSKSIMDSTKDTYLGEVYAYEKKPYEMNAWNANERKIEKTLVPDEWMVRIVVKASGSETDSEIKAGDYPIRVGKPIYVKGKGYARECYVVQLKTLEKGAEYNEPIWPK